MVTKFIMAPTRTHKFLDFVLIGTDYRKIMGIKSFNFEPKLCSSLLGRNRYSLDTLFVPK